jgi:hypothetical protein
MSIRLKATLLLLPLILIQERTSLTLLSKFSVLSRKLEGDVPFQFTPGPLKVSKTLSEEFNCKTFAMLDSVKDMEYMDKMMDPGRILKDPKYSKVGRFGLLGAIQHAYSIGLLLHFNFLRAITHRSVQPSLWSQSSHWNSSGSVTAVVEIIM